MAVQGNAQYVQPTTPTLAQCGVGVSAQPASSLAFNIWEVCPSALFCTTFKSPSRRGEAVAARLMGPGKSGACARPLDSLGLHHGWARARVGLT